jgi:phosphate transport system permease protein
VRSPLASAQVNATAKPIALGAGRPRDRRRAAARVEDALLHGVSALAAVLVVFVIVDIAYQLVHGANPAISRFGAGFLTGTSWKPNFNVFGAGTLLYGSAVSSLMALLLATPIGISIGLYLSMLAPRGVSRVIGPLVEMLAAIPSVILGFWGILVLGPFLQSHVEPSLHGTLSFIPVFGMAPTTGTGLFSAGLILTLMVLPIIASISRDLFATVPRELQEGAFALGATRWEMVRGIVLPSTASGVAAAAILGLGRALGEAIAVTQVIGAGTAIHASLFLPADTLASRIAEQFQGAATKLQSASLFYLALILLCIGLLSNGCAQLIARRFDPQRGVR